MDIDDVGRVVGAIVGVLLWVAAVLAMGYGARYLIVNYW